jgi:hypothetical protein
MFKARHSLADLLEKRPSAIKIKIAAASYLDAGLLALQRRANARGHAKCNG